MRLLSHRKSLDMANAFDSSFVPELFRSLQTACRSIVRLLVHKSIKVLAVLFALASASQPLEAHNAGIAACKKLGNDNSEWSKEEKKVWGKICEAKCFDLKENEDCQEEADNSGSENNDDRVPIQADFLHNILFQKCYRDVIGPRGVHIKNAEFEGKVDLSWGKIPWPLRLESCSFQSLTMHRFVAEREIILTNSEIADDLNIQSASIQRDLILKSLTVAKGRVNLTAARIGGNLSMVCAKFHDLDLDFASIGARVDGNAFANGFRQPITGSLIQNHIEHMLTSPEMHTPFGMTANGNPLTAKGDLIMSRASIAGKVNLSGTQVNGRLHLWDTGNGDTGNEKKVFLHGLTYDEIMVPQNNGKSTEKALKDWLGMDGSDSMQPYMYLASRLHAKNNLYISEQILFAGRKFLTSKKRIPEENLLTSLTESFGSFISRFNLYGLTDLYGFYYGLFDGLLFTIIMLIKKIYQSPVIMLCVLVLFIGVFVYELIKISRELEGKGRTKCRVAWTATLKALLPWPLGGRKKDPGTTSMASRACRLLPWPLGGRKKDSDQSSIDWILLAGKILLAIILVRLIWPVGIDMLLPIIF